MNPAPSRRPSPQILAALQRAREKDWLDVADLRLVEILVSRAGGSQESSDALALVIAALCRACAEGSLCLSLEKVDLGGALRDFLPAAGTPGDDAAENQDGVPAADAHAARFLSDLAAGRLDAFCPLIAARGNLYFHRHRHALKEIARALRARMEEGFTDHPDRDAHIADVLRETLTHNPLRAPDPDGKPLQLAQRQKWGLAAALRERVFVLSGGPGTGKTTWTASWLRALLRLPGVDPERVRLCAPTGRAAQRLQESLRAWLEGVTPPGATGPDAAARDMPVTTLHALLGYQPYSGRYARGPKDPLEADWVLVDEASMVDVFLFAALTRSLKPGARLLLVGDADQLPPVDAGSVLGELLPDDRLPRLTPAARATIAKAFPGDVLPHPDGTGPFCPSVMLDVGHRARGEVASLVAALLSGNSDAALARLGNPVDASADAAVAFGRALPVARLEPGNGPGAIAGLKAALHAFADATYLDRRGAGTRTYAEWLADFRVAPRGEEASLVKHLWGFVSAARVLAPLRRGTFSAENANRILRARLEPEWARRGDSPGQGFHGAPVLITRNDRGTGLSNGELGLWLESGSGPTVFFPRPDQPTGWLRLPAAQLPAHEPGFAVTVHKSQGSEYDEVLVILPEAGNRLLARETLYTAVTRARAAVRIFGTGQAVREALEKTLRRGGGLGALLSEDRKEGG